MSLLKTFKLGHEYAKIWPRHAVVAALTESRVVVNIRITSEPTKMNRFVYSSSHFYFLFKINNNRFGVVDLNFSNKALMIDGETRDQLA